MTTPPEKEVPRPAIVKFRASTALAVPAPQIFPSDAGIVTVTNWTERDGAGDRHRGLLVEVALDAADPDDAVRRDRKSNTSELQSPDHLVCRLLLEKKKIRHDKS